MTKYENIIKQKANKKPIDLDTIARKYNMSVTDVKNIKQMIHDAELETSLVKAVGTNSPEMKAAKQEIHKLKKELCEVRNDNRKLAMQVDNQVDRMRKAGLL